MERTSQNNYWSCQHRGLQACLDGPGQTPLNNWTFVIFISPAQIHCIAHTAHICWRWVALPFADQAFRFRTLFFSSVCSFFYPSVLGMHCGGICHFNLVSTHLHTPNWHFRLSGSHKTFPFSYMKCLCLLKFLLDKMFMKV